jgi:HK97 family phage major capsid protein
VFTQVLPSTTATQSGATYAYFGDLSMGATMGSRRGVTISSDTSRYFEFDQIALKATQRFDIAVHEIGTATAAGPIVALKMA